MKVLHTIAGLWAGTGGPVSSVTSLCSGLAARGHDVTLLTGSGPLHPAVLDMHPRVRVRTERLGPYRLGHWSSAFRAACLEEARRADIVHDHGVWLHTNWSSVTMAERAGRPVVRSPRGMLSPWALGRSRQVKRLLWRVAERRLFERTALVHVTSELEEREVRQLGVTTRTVVIPNGVDLEGEYTPSRIGDAYNTGIPEAEGGRVVLFLSRIHPKKGVDLLCRAWSTLPPDLRALLLIAGPGEEESLGKLRGWIADQPGPPARYIGPVEGDRKIALLSSAWLLALPSYSENYGMVVAEALACGTPVLTTTEVPWADLGPAGCGWIIPPEVDALAQALRGALRLTPEEHQPMRKSARALVSASHSLVGAITRMEQSYEDLMTRTGSGSASS